MASNSGFGFDIGSFLGAVASATGFGIGRSGMHAPTPEQAGANLLREAQAAGLSPALLAGQAPQTGFGASVGDAGTAGQLLARSITANRPADDRIAALKEQNLALQNAQLQNDVVAGQMRNSVQRVSLATAGTPPPRPSLPPFTLDEVWGAVHGPGQLSPKAAIQPFFTSGGLKYGPAAALQASLWSPFAGLTANPWAISEVTRMNASEMPAAPDVMRMSGAAPGSIAVLPGTAPMSNFWGQFIPNIEP